MRLTKIIVPLIIQLDAWSAGLPLSVRNSVLTPYRTRMMRYISAMPLTNAKSLLQHVDTGQLTLAAYDPRHVTAGSTGFNVCIRDSAQRRFDHVVTATGVHPPILHTDDQTVYLTDPPATATTLDHLDADLRLRLSPTAPPENIWLVGEATHIRTPYAHSPLLAVTQARHVAHQLPDIEGYPNVDRPL